MLMVFIPNPNARPVKVRNTKTWLLESLDDAAGFGMLDVEDPAAILSLIPIFFRLMFRF